MRLLIEGTGEGFVCGKSRIASHIPVTKIFQGDVVTLLSQLSCDVHRLGIPFVRLLRIGFNALARRITASKIIHSDIVSRFSPFAHQLQSLGGIKRDTPGKKIAPAQILIPFGAAQFSRLPIAGQGLANTVRNK